MTNNEEFEKWAYPAYSLEKRKDGNYKSNETRVACAGYQARQPEIDALKAVISTQQDELFKFRAEVERLRGDAERFAILLREFMYCEVQSTEEIEEGSELIKKYRVMKETK